jgi:hypothetical protein
MVKDLAGQGNRDLGGQNLLRAQQLEKVVVQGWPEGFLQADSKYRIHGQTHQISRATDLASERRERCVLLLRSMLL